MEIYVYMSYLLIGMLQIGIEMNVTIGLSELMPFNNEMYDVDRW